MAPLFPDAPAPEDFEPLSRNETLLRPGVDAVARSLGLDPDRLRRFPDGSLPVYAAGGGRVLKIYPPFDLPARDREAAALRAVAGRLTVPTPGVHARGELGGWGYLLMDRLRGESLAAAWPRIPDPGRRRLAEALGEALASLHALRGDGLDPLRGDWHAFVAEQRLTAVDRQRARGLDEHWLAQIPEFLRGLPLPGPAGGGPGRRAPDCSPGPSADLPLLHTEVMREHLLVEEGPRGWRLSGLFDFEPAMTGEPEYEFVAVGLFVSCGEVELLRRALRAYGYAEASLDADLERRLLAYALLHRYSHLPWYLQRLPPPPGARTLEALASHWWGLGGAAAL